MSFNNKSIIDKVKEFDVTANDGFQVLKPRYEYTVKIFDEGERGKPITSIQRGIQANSDADLHALYALSDQTVQILEKREINPPQNNEQQQVVSMTNQMPKTVVQQQKPIAQTQTILAQKPIEPQIKYFSGGGVDFKIVGDEVYQKQWIRATEEDCRKIRIINDSNNKIVELKGKHIELLNWVKVESTDKDAN